MNQDHHEFVRKLGRLGAEDIRRAGAIIEASDPLEWLRVTMAIDRALRRQSASVEAAVAARRAAAAVEMAARDSGLDPDDGDVVHLSQRAAECARGLIVSGFVLPHLSWLLSGWQDVIGYRLQAPSWSPLIWLWERQREAAGSRG